MKNRVYEAIALVVIVLTLGTTQTWAQSPLPLKGKWQFTLQTPGGTVPVGLAFHPNGTGTIDLAEPLPFVYREDGDDFSITLEVPPQDSPAGQAFTLLMRGRKLTDTALDGILLMITDTPDPSRAQSDAIQVVVIPGQVTGRRP
jgi:hypothetical protein